MVHLPVSVAGTCFLCQVLSPHLPLNASFQKHGHTESYRVIPSHTKQIGEAYPQHFLSMDYSDYINPQADQLFGSRLFRSSGSRCDGPMAQWPNGPMAHSLGPSRAHAGPMGMTPNSSNLVYDILVTCAGSTIPTILDEGRHFWMPPLVSVFQRWGLQSLVWQDLQFYDIPPLMVSSSYIQYLRNTVYLESGNVADGLSHFSCDRLLAGLKEFGGGVSNLVRGAAFQVVSQNWSHPNLMASFG